VGETHTPGEREREREVVWMGWVRERDKEEENGLNQKSQKNPEAIFNTNPDLNPELIPKF
jgi:hypothetical protein